ncbi:ADP-ribosylation factor 9 [Labeo rohita]|uniref:ADP-ribosylation factor 9 n=1 Tax=Labeo rohita TaxID=84645 RepID=A0A498L4W9_LABRO|nr:ADP-ribosylation factor 9 [Labeo rohita]RXN10657.1 ADP-ribosylation factor 9 [Labeo rohita]
MAAVGTALFIALNLFYKRRVWTPESDYYTFREEDVERSEKQVLVLGLDGAVGGGEDLRMYWVDYLRRTHVLVYVVDSSDRGRLPQAKDELHRLLKADTDLPVVVLGNKQDKPNAVSVPELHEALSLSSVADQRKLFLLAAQSESDGLSRTCGLQKFQDLLLTLV